MTKPKFRRINLFGRPGIGKSTVAAHIYHQMKIRGLKVELINEYVKSWAYMGRPIRSFDQVYVFGKQINAEDRLLFHSKLDYIIADSPILIQCCYAQLSNDPVRHALRQLVRLFDQQFAPLNVFLDSPTEQHQDEGRFHNLETARASAEIMKAVLIEEYGGYITWDPKDPVGLSKHILDKLEIQDATGPEFGVGIVPDGSNGGGQPLPYGPLRRSRDALRKLLSALRLR